MMPGGRPPKPTATHKARGTFRADRHAQRRADATPGVPVKPRGLTPGERSAWDSIIRAAEHVPGLLSKADAVAIEGAARAVHRWRQAAREVEKLRGEFVVTGSHGPRAHPALQIERESWAVARQALGMFGMTPTSRAALRLPDGADDPFAALMATLSAAANAVRDGTATPPAPATAKKKTPARAQRST